MLSALQSAESQEGAEDCGRFPHLEKAHVAFQDISLQLLNRPDLQPLLSDFVRTFEESFKTPAGADIAATQRALMAAMGTLSDYSASVAATSMEQIGRKIMADASVQQAVLAQADNPTLIDNLYRSQEVLLEDPDVAEILRDVQQHGEQAILRHAFKFEALEKLAAAVEHPLEPVSAQSAAPLVEDSMVWSAFLSSNDEMSDALQKGANVNHVVSRQEGVGNAFTTLHAAAAYGDSEAIQVLLKHGASIDARAAAGPGRAGHSSTPLHWAVSRAAAHESSNLVGVVKLLIKEGANKTLCNEEGQTPYQVCDAVMEQVKNPEVLMQYLDARKELKVGK